MTRGPPPRSVRAAAAAIAGRRGTLKWFEREPGDSSHFGIFGTDDVSIAAIRRARRLWAGPEEICREFHETISQLKAAVLTSHVIRELWLCSYHGTWRFFQIVGRDLAEIDREGRPVDGPCLAPSGRGSA
jgi:hypothetical protein